MKIFQCRKGTVPAAQRPVFCAFYYASEDFCGRSASEVLEHIALIEVETESH